MRAPTGLSSFSMYSDHFFFLITDLLEYKNLLRICSKPPKTGTQFVRTQQMSKCLIIPDVFYLRYPNNKSSLFLKKFSSSLLVHILSFHFHHLHLQLRPANLKNFKLRLHFELETQYNNLLSFPILIQP